ncbi:MAG TPA: mandelate racemase/muconate lactonizing enzyme family protein [Trebonia sp.]|jgi:L-alanine-DL-glutamate epimerase-like enolase superfamily enzyme|nr:mandelate racemase/muconate lactonizing enzyme family protein [Trebonia sp.]
MRIDRVRPVLLSYDTRDDPPLEWVGGTITTWDAALVEVTTASGATGLGEVAQSTMAAEAVPGIVDALRRYLPAGEFQGREIGDHLRAQTRFWARGGISSGVIAAISTACLDAEAREAGVPLWRHLAADPSAVPDSIEAYASGGLGTTNEQVAGWVAEQEAAGFGTVKIRAMRDPRTTIELLDYLRERLSGGTRVALDLVQGCASHPWSVADAISVGQAFAERLPYRWYEEPCAAEDIKGYAAVTAAVDVPVSGVESYSVPEDFEHLMDAGGVNIVQPDLSMMGGFSCFERVVASARRRGVDAIPHVWGSGVQLLTSVHAAFALGMPLVEVCTLLNPMRDATQEHPLTIARGRIARADLAAAGSGAALPAGAEERFAYQYGKGMLIK